MLKISCSNQTAISSLSDKYLKVKRERIVNTGTFINVLIPLKNDK